MRAMNDGLKNDLGLDFEENLEGFIHFLNWLSLVSYMPTILAMAGVMVAVLLGFVRLKTAGRTFAALVALNWVSLRWLEHRFLVSAKK